MEIPAKDVAERLYKFNFKFNQEKKMANRITSVVNTTPVTFQLNNWIKGSTTPADDVVIKPNGTTITGGKDNNFINIPDATPPLQYFCLDNMAFTSTTVNLFLYESQGTVYWTQNGPPNPNNQGNAIANSASLGTVTLTIGQQAGGAWTMIMNAS